MWGVCVIANLSVLMLDSCLVSRGTFAGIRSRLDECRCMAQVWLWQPACCCAPLADLFLCCLWCSRVCIRHSACTAPGVASVCWLAPASPWDAFGRVWCLRREGTGCWVGSAHGYDGQEAPTLAGWHDCCCSGVGFWERGWLVWAFGWAYCPGLSCVQYGCRLAGFFAI